MNANPYQEALANPYQAASIDRSDMIDNIFAFNRDLLGVKNREKGLLSEKELDYAIKAGVEELMEFEDAHESKDFISAVDAICDLLYFGVGFLARMGLAEDEVRRCMEAVHEANMQKKLGVQQKRGGEGVADAVKPADWVGPEERIAEVLGG